MITTDITNLTTLVKRALQKEPAEIRPIAASGSTRRYYEILFGQNGKIIGTCGTVKAENDAFIYLSRHFAERGLCVPEVIASDDETLCYLQTSAGDQSLYDLICSDPLNSTLARGMKLRRTLDNALYVLAAIQFDGAKNLDWSKCYPVESMDRRSVMWDLNYFKYNFLKLFHNHFDEPALEADFERLCKLLTEGEAAGYDTFQLRDFQSRNIMVDESKNLTVIDFQGGRRGLPFYDAVSYIYQSRAGFDTDLRLHLEGTYYAAISRYIDIDARHFLDWMLICRLFRLLQTLGAYGFRGLWERRQKFIDALPAAITEIESLPEKLGTQFPELYSALRTAARNFRANEPTKELLTVAITSFSYKKGYPTDDSGNGGGFVFDCRAMHNPGRYPQYKNLTGRDRAVVDFLSERGECHLFEANALSMVKPTVQRYLDRGFTHLNVAFGCTGGQHRSVFCADLLAADLRKLFPQIRIVVHHREQEILETDNPAYGAK